MGRARQYGSLLVLDVGFILSVKMSFLMSPIPIAYAGSLVPSVSRWIFITIKWCRSNILWEDALWLGLHHLLFVGLLNGILLFYLSFDSLHLLLYYAAAESGIENGEGAL